MSAIQIQEIHRLIENLSTRMSNLEARLEETHTALNNATARVEATGKELHKTIEDKSEALEKQINASVTATLASSLDVVKTDLRAFAKSIASKKAGATSE